MLKKTIAKEQRSAERAAHKGGKEKMEKNEKKASETADASDDSDYSDPEAYEQWVMSNPAMCIVQGYGYHGCGDEPYFTSIEDARNVKHKWGTRA